MRKLTSFAASAFDARGVDDFGFRDRVKWFRFSPSFVAVFTVRIALVFPWLPLLFWADSCSELSLLLSARGLAVPPLELLLLRLVRTPVEVVWKRAPTVSLASSSIAAPYLNK